MTEKKSNRGGPRANSGGARAGSGPKTTDGARGVFPKLIRVTPEQNEWLNDRPEGASAAVRMLIDNARENE